MTIGGIERAIKVTHLPKHAKGDERQLCFVRGGERRRERSEASVADAHQHPTRAHHALPRGACRVTVDQAATGQSAEKVRHAVHREQLADARRAQAVLLELWRERWVRGFEERWQLGAVWGN
jgi:hypothetical protein